MQMGRVLRLLASSLVLMQIQMAATPRNGSIIPIGNSKQLFLDEFLLESLKDTALVLNHPRKAVDNPVIPRNRPWEGNYNHYGTVFYDPDQRKFRMWYSTSNWTPVPGGDPESAGRRICYAVSSDGYRWEKPSLGLVEFNGSRDNNIVGEDNWLGFKGGIVFDAREPDPSKRYKAMVQTVGGKLSNETGRTGMQFHLYSSGDAFNWSAHPGNPVIDWGERRGRWGPTSVMGWDPVHGVYVAHMEICGHQRCPLGRRIIGRAESPDMIRWSEAVPVILPDGQDYPDTEFYSLHATAYEGFTIGMLWNFRTTNTTILPQFVFSRDGIHYDRRYRRPFIPAGAGDAFDSVAIYGLRPAVHGEKIFFYYGGVNWRSPEQLEMLGEERAYGAIGLAVLPLDGFVSLDGPKLTFSQAVTRTLTFSGRELRLNLRAAFQRWGAHPAEVRVEILGTDYKPISGYGFDDCDPLSETGTGQLVTWRGNSNVEALAGKPVKLRFHFKNAKLFAFQFVPGKPATAQKKF